MSPWPLHDSSTNSLSAEETNTTRRTISLTQIPYGECVAQRHVCMYIFVCVYARVYVCVSECEYMATCIGACEWGGWMGASVDVSVCVRTGMAPGAETQAAASVAAADDGKIHSFGRQRCTG